MGSDQYPVYHEYAWRNEKKLGSEILQFELSDTWVILEVCLA
jgi:hypothetical protein